MESNLTTLIKEVDKTMITERGGFKLIVTYAALGFYDTYADRQNNFTRSVPSLYSIQSDCQSSLLECLIGEGFDINYKQ